MNRPISITLVTGFLGSGKTTLIRRLLPDPRLRGSLVIVNDMAPIGLDHLLLQQDGSEPILLANGCICCSVNKDLGVTLLDVLRRMRSGELPALTHVIIETTGMADPIPILRLLVANAALAESFALERIVTMVSAPHGRAQLKRHPEARLQVAVADFVLISQGPTISDAERDGLQAQIAGINPIADVVADADRFSAQQLIAHTRFARQAIPEPSVAEGRQATHGTDIAVACILARRPLDWERLVGWVETLGETLGENLLRLKGTITVAGSAAPLFINGVQDSFYPPILLPDWIDPTGGSRLVIIARGLDAAGIERSFRTAVDP